MSTATASRKSAKSPIKKTASASTPGKRGIEVLTGPTLHLQHIRRGEAARIEAGLAGALADAGIHVEGGH